MKTPAAMAEARIGEWDSGWIALKVFERAGLVWNLATPEMLPPRKERVEIGGEIKRASVGEEARI